MTALDELIDSLKHDDGCSAALGPYRCRCNRDEAQNLARRELTDLRLALSERERRVGELERALREIVEGTPIEEPSRGDYTGNADDDYEAGLNRAHWGCAQIARAIEKIGEQQ